MLKSPSWTSKASILKHTHAPTSYIRTRSQSSRSSASSSSPLHTHLQRARLRAIESAPRINVLASALLYRARLSVCVTPKCYGIVVVPPPAASPSPSREKREGEKRPILPHVQSRKSFRNGYIALDGKTRAPHEREMNFATSVYMSACMHACASTFQRVCIVGEKEEGRNMRSVHRGRVGDEKTPRRWQRQLSFNAGRARIGERQSYGKMKRERSGILMGSTCRARVFSCGIFRCSPLKFSTDILIGVSIRWRI